MLHKSKALTPIPAAQGQDKWIWIANPDPVPDSYIQVRKLFVLSSKPTHAEIKASADTRYKLYVNGQYIGKGPVRSGEGYTYFDTHDVTEHLVKGKNVIAVLAHHIGERTRSYIPGKPGLICKVDLDVDGEKLEFGTDETWKARRAADWTNAGTRLNAQLGFQEVYDANGAQEDWREVKFSEKGWEDAVAVGEPGDAPWGELAPRQIPQLREETLLPREVIGAYNSPDINRDAAPAEIPDLVAAAELSVLKAGSAKRTEALLTEDGDTEIRTPRGDRGVTIILDFGREVFGNVELGIGGSGTGCIDLGYGEALLDGRVKPNVGDTRYTDRVLLKKGKLAWQGFEPRAFRYLQIEFRRCSKPVTVDYIRVNQTTYPVQRSGMFECNDRLLNDIWDAGALTAQLCMEDTLIDCPWRERAQWWGDARVLSRTAYYAFDDTKLLAQGLRQIASSQDRDGTILGLYPSGEEMQTPDFAFLWMFSMLDYFGFADDDELVKELYPAVEALLGWFARFENESGMLENVPGALLIDRADLERDGEVTSLNCLYYQGLRVAWALATICEKPEAAQDYLDKANRLKVTINKFMYVPRRGLYAECRKDGKLVEKFSRQANTFAALFDIGDQYQKAGIFRVLSNGSLPEVATPYFGSFYLEALYSIDAHDRALDYIRRKWGEMVKSGSMTLWESFNQEGALCHGSATCPTRDLIAEYVGIKPVLGAHRFSVTPHIADLKWAKGEVNTKHGPLTVEWHLLRNRLDIDLVVPEGLKVDVYPPGPIDSSISADGKHSATRVITLSGGRHHVRVTAPRAPGAVTYDEAPSIMPHVEVLEHGVRIGRHGTPMEPRGRTRSRRRDGEKVIDLPVTSEEAMVVGFAEIEPVESTEGAAPPEQPKSRRRSRGRGGRGRSASAETPAIEAPHGEAAPEPVIEPVSAEAPEAAEETGPPKRRRRSRGRGGRGRSAASAEAHTIEAPHEEPTPEQAAEAVPAESTETTEEAALPRRRRRSRGRGGRGRSGASAETPAVEAPHEEPAPEPIVEAIPAETTETTEEAAAPRRRRRSRGRGGRGRSASAETPTIEAPHEEPAPEPAIEPVPAEAPEAAGEAPKHRRRSRGRGGRGRSSSATEQPADIEHAEPAPTPEPEPPVETHAEETVEQPKPKRRTYRRRTPKAESDNAAPAEGSGEA